MNALPRISIVTPSFNQGKYLEETICSVLSQNYPNLEYIVIDGGSTDGSNDIIRKYKRHLKYWISEPDGGQSDALNKGFRKASGEILGWINSDDCYLPGALLEVGNIYKQSPESFIAGPVININEVTQESEIIRPENITFENKVKFGLLTEKSVSWHQPGVFFPRKQFEKIGGVDPHLKYVMDHDLFCRLLQHTSIVYTKKPLAKFRIHPDAKTYQLDIEFWEERIRLLKKWSTLEGMKTRIEGVLPGLFGEAHILLASQHYRRGERNKALRHSLAALRKCPKLVFKKWLYTGFILPYLTVELGFNGGRRFAAHITETK